MKLWKDMDELERIEHAKEAAASGVETLADYSRYVKMNYNTVASFINRRGGWENAHQLSSKRDVPEELHDIDLWDDMTNEERFEALKRFKAHSVVLVNACLYMEIGYGVVREWMRKFRIRYRTVCEQTVDFSVPTPPENPIVDEDEVVECTCWDAQLKALQEAHPDIYAANMAASEKPDLRGILRFDAKAYQASLNGEWNPEDYRAQALLDQAMRLARQVPALPMAA